MIEEAGFPVVQITTMPIVAQSVGIRRLVVGGGIPHPLGNPVLTPEEERVFRDQLVQKALDQLLTSPTGQVDGNTT